MSPLSITCKFFDSLTPVELYDILRLRSEIFVVEQHCVFLDMDNKDQQCWHLMLHENNQLIGYARIVPPGVSYTEMSIGRVVVHLSKRKTGTGKQLMEHAIDECYKQLGPGPIRIGAQCYAQRFYEQLGFRATGEIYDEDGIDHIEMVRN